MQLEDIPPAESDSLAHLDLDDSVADAGLDPNAMVVVHTEDGQEVAVPASLLLQHMLQMQANSDASDDSGEEDATDDDLDEELEDD